MPDAAAIVLLAGATLYAVFAGADFGGGLWDLLAGGAERGKRPRALIERSLTPVWEANHVWLIFILVVAWTAFPEAFSAVMSTLFVPLTLAAVGIVLRGSGFAFRKIAGPLARRRELGALFAISSVLTPFFMGAVVGAIASGRVPAGGGDRTSSWTGTTSLVVGALFVAAGAYMAAVFLVSDAHRAGEAELESYFRRRAIGAGVVTGALALAGLAAFHADARQLYDGLTHDALPLVIASAVAGLGALTALASGAVRAARPLAALAVATVVAGWGVAQHPYLLPGSLTVSQAAAPDSTLTALLIVIGAAVVIVVPALALLYTLHQRSLLDDD